MTSVFVHLSCMTNTNSRVNIRIIIILLLLLLCFSFQTFNQYGFLLEISCCCSATAVGQILATFFSSLRRYFHFCYCCCCCNVPYHVNISNETTAESIKSAMPTTADTERTSEKGGEEEYKFHKISCGAMHQKQQGNLCDRHSHNDPVMNRCNSNQTVNSAQASRPRSHAYFNISKLRMHCLQSIIILFLIFSSSSVLPRSRAVHIRCCCLLLLLVIWSLLLLLHWTRILSSIYIYRFELHQNGI